MYNSVLVNDGALPFLENGATFITNGSNVVVQSSVLEYLVVAEYVMRFVDLKLSW
jgi:hypothetical protein